MINGIHRYNRTLIGIQMLSYILPLIFAYIFLLPGYTLTRVMILLLLSTLRYPILHNLYEAEYKKEYDRCISNSMVVEYTTLMRDVDIHDYITDHDVFGHIFPDYKYDKSKLGIFRKVVTELSSDRTHAAGIRKTRYENAKKVYQIIYGACSAYMLVMKVFDIYDKHLLIACIVIAYLAANLIVYADIVIFQCRYVVLNNISFYHETLYASDEVLENNVKNTLMLTRFFANDGNLEEDEDDENNE